MTPSKTLHLSTSKLVVSRNKLLEDQKELEDFHDKICESQVMNQAMKDMKRHVGCLSPRIQGLLLRSKSETSVAGNLDSVRAGISSKLKLMAEYVPAPDKTLSKFYGKKLLKKYLYKLRLAKHSDYTEKEGVYEEARDDPFPPFTPMAEPGKKKKRVKKRP